MITAVALFILGSGISGGALNMSVLIVGRAIQGAGGGGISMLCNLIVCDLVPLRHRGSYTAIIFIAITAANGIGMFSVSPEKTALTGSHRSFCWRNYCPEDNLAMGVLAQSPHRRCDIATINCLPTGWLQERAGHGKAEKNRLHRQRHICPIARIHPNRPDIRWDPMALELMAYRRSSGIRICRIWGIPSIRSLRILSRTNYTPSTVRESHISSGLCPHFPPLPPYVLDCLLLAGILSSRTQINAITVRCSTTPYSHRTHPFRGIEREIPRQNRAISTVPPPWVCTHDHRIRSIHTAGF